MQEFKVTSKAAGQRVDIFVANKFPEFTRSALRELFQKQLVTSNQMGVKPSHKLRVGERVKVDSSLLSSRPSKIDLPVVYEDQDVVIINKPAGLLTHSKGALNIEPSVASFLSDRITDAKLTGNRAGIVHRLDRGTSGLIIGAKNKQAQQWLQKQFAKRQVKKTYKAIVEGHPNPKSALIDAPIERNPKRRQTFRIGPEGKAAQTEYEVVENFILNGKPYSLVVLRPATGRTHQLRAHLAYIGHPVVGDKVYGHGGKQLLLHAAALEIILPDGLRKRFKVILPIAFKEFKTDE